MRFSLGCALDYTILQPTTLILNVEAMRSAQQHVIAEKLALEPAMASDVHEAEGTGNRYRRLVVQPGPLTLRYEATVETLPVTSRPESIPSVPISTLPLDVMPYLYPSRYCESDTLGTIAWKEFGSLASGHEQVTGVCNWVYENIPYTHGVSTSATSAHDTYIQRAGVCRDLAHLSISFCRALGIPARFVSAYGWQLYPQDFHAVFEAYLGGRWYLFDPTRLCPIDGIVRIGVGRDAADTAFSTFYGEVQDQPKSVWIEPTDTADVSAQWTTDAVSVSTN